MNIVRERNTSRGSASERERVVLAKAVMRAFDEWQLPNADRQVLLGLGPNSRTTLNRYASGSPLNNTRDLLDRVGHILGIYKGFQLLYPENPEIRECWLRSPNRRFHGRTPIEVVRQFGLPGLLMVRAQVDRMRGH